MASSISTGAAWNTLKKILGATWETTMNDARKGAVFTQYLDEVRTTDRYYDDLEIVDMGLFTEKQEGQNIALDSFSEGLPQRFLVKTFAKRLSIPEELIADQKYPKVFNMRDRLAHSAALSMEYDAVSVLNNAFSSSFTGADGVSLCNSAHPLKGGGTVSNAPTALSLSNTSIQTYLVAAEKLGGTNGLIHGVKGVKLIVPTDRRFRAKEILKSEKKDDTSNNTMNALRGELSDTPVSVPWMTSTTNWFLKTNAQRGIMWVWRQEPEFRVTSTDTALVKDTLGFFRATRGWSNFRALVGSNI